MLTINISGSLQDAFNGSAQIQVQAASIRELLGKLTERYPGFAAKLELGVAVAVNGDIYRDNRDEPIPADAEVFLLPRIEGG